ncbi:transposase [Methylobacter luteus]|uniref:transposase n=1 Tax=Methylobacter luteus TaxID=415 RepID=UPI002F2B8514
MSKRSVFFQSRLHFSETREDFRHFMGQVLRDVPDDKEVHMILDNYCTRKKNDEWLKKRGGRVQFHFTPASASWLNENYCF